MKIAFLLYPTAQVKVREDSSFWVMHEMVRRGHEVYHFESCDLFVENGSPKAYVYTTAMNRKKGFLPTSLSKKPFFLRGFDALFIRKEPPFDNGYLYAMQILELLRDQVFMMNEPRGIVLFNEKLSILNFPELIPETLVTEDAATAKVFIQKLKKRVVIKPLDQKAGSGILATHAADKNLPSILDIATGFSKNKIMVQRFIETSGSLDKRILILNGEVLGVFARKPSPGDFRSNLSVGGSMHRTTLGAEDRRIVQRISPTLVKNGLYFVGIDVMGRFLTEINVTSPSGIPEINALYRKKIQEKVAEFIEEKV